MPNECCVAYTNEELLDLLNEATEDKAQKGSLSVVHRQRNAAGVFSNDKYTDDENIRNNSIRKIS